MSWVLLLLLVVLSASIIAWGMQERTRIYQLPFLASLVVLLYVCPSFAAICDSAEFAQHQGALSGTLLMTMFSLAGVWIGFQKGAAIPVGERPAREPNYDRVFWGGVGLGGVSLAAYAMLGRMTGGGVTGWFNAESTYAVALEGPIVLLKLFTTLIYPALMMVFVSAAESRLARRYLVFGVLCLVPLANMLLLGRRSETMRFGFILLLGAYFYRGIVLPRIAILAGAPLALVAILVAPAYRHQSEGGVLDRLANIETAEILEGFFEKGSSEVRNGIYILGAYEATAGYRFGTTYYNGLVRTVVPRFIVGDEFKKALYIGEDVRDQTTLAVYGWKRAVYSFPFGPSVAFEQFWYLGCLVYAAIGFGMGVLWRRAHLGIACQVLYAILIIPSMITLLTDQTNFFTAVFYTFALVGPVLIWCTRPAEPEPAPEELHESELLPA